MSISHDKLSAWPENLTSYDMKDEKRGQTTKETVKISKNTTSSLFSLRKQHSLALSEKGRLFLFSLLLSTISSARMRCKWWKSIKNSVVSILQWSFAVVILRQRYGVIVRDVIPTLQAPVVRKPISANPRLNRPNPQNKFVLRLNSVPRSSISTIQVLN